VLSAFDGTPVRIKDVGKSSLALIFGAAQPI